MNLNIYKCPICGGEMEKKYGRYGYFFGCKLFKKTGCKGTINIPINDLSIEYINYDEFIKSDPTEYLLKYIDTNDVPDYIKKLRSVLDGRKIEKGTIWEEDIKGKISGIFDYLVKKRKFFLISKLAYWFFKLDGDLQGKVDYWINRVPKDEHRKEYHIRKALIEEWYLVPLSFRGYELYGIEYEIGKFIGSFGGYRIDLVAQDFFTDELIFIEVKAPRKKGTVAMNQIMNYVRFYNKSYPDKKINKAYIICHGYPRTVFDDDDLDYQIGVVGYVIEGDKISFIPWKIV